MSYASIETHRCSWAFHGTYLRSAKHKYTYEECDPSILKSLHSWMLKVSSVLLNSWLMLQATPLALIFDRGLHFPSPICHLTCYLSFTPHPGLASAIGLMYGKRTAFYVTTRHHTDPFRSRRTVVVTRGPWARQLLHKLVNHPAFTNVCGGASAACTLQAKRNTIMRACTRRRWCIIQNYDVSASSPGA